MDESSYVNDEDNEKNEIEAAEQKRIARDEEAQRLKEEMRDALADEEAKLERYSRIESSAEGLI